MVMGLTHEQMEVFTRAHESLVAQMKRRGRGFDYSVGSLKDVETLCGGFRLLREEAPARMAPRSSIRYRTRRRARSPRCVTGPSDELPSRVMRLPLRQLR